MEQHKPFIRRCIELSFQARKKGNLPFGSLLVLDGKIVLEAENTSVTEGNPLAHAEINLLGEAAQRLPREAIQRATLYSSVEPCIMCCGAMLHSGVRRLVFGCTEKSLQKIIPAYPYVESKKVFELLGIDVQLEQVDMEAEVLKAHEGFWT